MKTLTFDNRLIFHVDYHPYAAIIMAFGITHIENLFWNLKAAKIIRVPISLLLLLLLLSSPYSSWKFLHNRNNTQRTLSFIQNNIDFSQENAMLVTLLQSDIGKYDPNVPFPLYRKGIPVISIGDFLKMSDDFLHKKIKIYYFESPACYTYDLRDFVTGFDSTKEAATYNQMKKWFEKVDSSKIHMKRKICEDIESSFSMVPIKTELFESEADYLTPVPQKTIRIGLYELTSGQ